MKRRRCFSIVSLFADNAVYFPSRTCARPRNKYYCACFLPPSVYAEKNMPRNIPVSQRFTKKLSGKVKKKSCKSWSLRKSA